jgi:predicted ribonuclease toxin of YeeF-YezG toxin-antitoxin module
MGVLRLRKKTAEHLQKLDENQEYLIARYGPEMATAHTEITQLLATMKDVSEKVKKHMN